MFIHHLENCWCWCERIQLETFLGRRIQNFPVCRLHQTEFSPLAASMNRPTAASAVNFNRPTAASAPIVSTKPRKPICNFSVSASRHRFAWVKLTAWGWDKGVDQRVSGGGPPEFTVAEALTDQPVTSWLKVWEIIALYTDDRQVNHRSPSFACTMHTEDGDRSLAEAAVGLFVDAMCVEL